MDFAIQNFGFHLHAPDARYSGHTVLPPASLIQMIRNQKDEDMFSIRPSHGTLVDGRRDDDLPSLTIHFGGENVSKRTTTIALSKWQAFEEMVEKLSGLLR
jgi:hypothetical protein